MYPEKESRQREFGQIGLQQMPGRGWAQARSAERRHKFHNIGTTERIDFPSAIASLRLLIRWRGTLNQRAYRFRIESLRMQLKDIYQIRQLAQALLLSQRAAVFMQL